LWSALTKGAALLFAAGVIAAGTTVATAQTAPAAPTLTTVTPGNAALTAVFTAGSDGGSPITDYQYSSDNASTWKSAGVISGPITFTTVSGSSSALVNGTSYYVRIRAVNAVGNGAQSGYIVAIPGTPTAPTVTGITATSDGTLNVAFTAGSDNGFAITNYQYSSNNGSNYTNVNPASTASPIIIPKLTGGTSYNVKIRAVNSKGNGEASATTAATPTLDPVTWTTNANMASTGSDLDNSGTILAAINFSQTKSASTINSIAFTVNTSLTGSGTYWALNLNTNRSNFDPSRFTSGATYYGTPWSSISLGSLIDDVINTYTDQGEVQNVKIQNLTVGHQYKMQMVFEAGNGRTGQLWSGGSTSSSVSYGGSAAGAAMITASWTASMTTRTFQQVVHSGCVAGFVLSDVTVVPPSAPAITVITPGDGTLSVAFTPPTSNGGAAITNYEYSSDHGTTFTAVSPASTASPIAISGLANGTPYTVVIRAVNSAGAGASSSPVTGTPAATATIPGPPTITGITPGNTTLSVAFTPGATGGAAITDYKVSTDGGTSWTATGQTTSPLAIGGLTNGTAYTVEILAVNSVGEGSPSNSMSGTPATIASAPTITAITPGSGTLSVAFTMPASNGGAAISNYKYSTDGGSTYVAVAPAAISSPIPISGLTGGTTYTVMILAVNSAGDGTPGGSMSGTPYGPPTAPTITGITPGNGTLSVAFDPPASDGGSTITNYRYSTNNGGTYTAVAPASTTSPILITGLTGGTSCTVKIEAVNAAGNGTASDAMSGTPTAAAITWTTTTNMAQNGSDLVNTGSILAAINFTPDAVGAYTLNGIPFTIQSSATGSGTYWQVLNTGSGTGMDNNRLGGQTYYPTDPSAFPLGYLIDDYKYMFTDSGQTQDFVMQNLTVGAIYRLQMVFERNNGATGRLVTGGNSSPTVSYGAASGAAMITAGWTATATTQTFRQPIQAACVAGFVLTDLSVTTGTSYTTWASTNGATPNPLDDSNNNGVANGIEFFMGGTLASPATLPPLVDNAGTWSWTIPYDPNAAASYYFQVSDDLNGWTDVVPGVTETRIVVTPPVSPATLGTVQFTLPAGTGKKFCRLVVTPN